MRTRRIPHYGWVPDHPDQRDWRFNPRPETFFNLPQTVDLRGQCPAIVDQGQLGSCTANALASALEFEQMHQNLSAFQPSRLFIYYQERSIEGTVDTDSGAQLRDGVKVLAEQGAPPESDWPYDITQFATQPPQQSYTDALQDRALQYWRVLQTAQFLRACLAEGYPFVFGFTVYESFEADRVGQTGIVPMPAATEQSIGGHAVMAVGYDDEQQTFLVRNSWGSDWGMAGYCTMPYAYLTDQFLARDFWTLRLVGQ